MLKSTTSRTVTLSSLKQSRRALRETRAFTLMEILVVLAIGAMIAGLAIANLDTIFGSSKEKTAKMYLQQMEVPLMQYRMDIGDYPSTAEGLNSLIVAPADKAARWRAAYVKGGQEKLLDPWEQPYQYRYPGTRNKAGYDLWSKGPDKQDGTADDIGNWTSETAGATQGGTQ